jgi:glycosyltransferase involved in cell wall biosynthesis
MSPLWTHQTAGPGPKARSLRRLLAEGDFDVVHVHNVSLLGLRFLEELRGLTRGVTLMTAHEHWLICPTHVLWKNDREPCVEPECVRCTLQARRPPQLWRRNGTIPKAIEALDGLMFPSGDALARHRARGIGATAVAIPYFIPAAWAATGAVPVADHRPYIAAAGRLIRPKGFQRLIPLMRELPDLDLRIAGGGSLERELRALGRSLPNVHFEGWLDATGLVALFRGARAVVVPSLSPETFGFVAAEALALGRPVVVHDIGAIASLARESGGGIVYGRDEELVDALRLLGSDTRLGDELGARGAAYAADELSEERHLERYLGLIGSLRGAPQPLAVGA